jgi:glycosyltransferase involved in cell wall biosynthesis
MKGHMELVRAFAEADFKGRRAVLILNGNEPEHQGQKLSALRLILILAREYGWKYALRHGLKMLLRSLGIHVGRASSIRDWAEKVNLEQGPMKSVLVADLPRVKLVQAFLHADLFVFASNVEYSPLVLYEACAAGLPFLSVPVGNSEEIAAWTGGGEICPAPKDALEYTRVSPTELARHIEALASEPERLARMGRNGLAASRARYNWDNLTQEYEALFMRLMNNPSPVSDQREGRRVEI